MIRALIVFVAILGIASFAFAQGMGGKAEVMNLSGTVIDNMCGYGHEADIATFIKEHTKECALMAECVASGYSFYNQGKLTKFDQASNMKVEEFLRQTDSKLDVVIEASMAGDELHLVSIRNQ